jgi:hypothetical protein
MPELTLTPDDGIVVVGVRKERVVMRRVSAALREQLGDEAARDLEEYANGAGAEWRDDVMDAATERFDVRLEAMSDRFDNRLATVAAELRLEMAGLRLDLQRELHGAWQAIAELKISLRKEIADGRVELLRWSFVFWIGEVSLLAGLITYMLRGVTAK